MKRKKGRCKMEDKQIIKELLTACKQSLKQFDAIAEHYGVDHADAEIKMLNEVIRKAQTFLVSTEKKPFVQYTI